MASFPTNELPPNERPPVETEPLGSRGYEDDGRQHGYGREEWHERRREWRRERRQERGLDRFFWPALLILAGFVFLAENVGALPGAVGADAWDWMMVGAGALLFTGQLLRAAAGNMGEPSIFWMIGGAVLVAFGLSDILAISFDFGDWWPLILIVLGISALAKGLRR